MISNENRREQTIISKEMSNEIKKLSDKTGLSRSKVIGILLGMGLTAFTSGIAAGDKIGEYILKHRGKES